MATGRASSARKTKRATGAEKSVRSRTPRKQTAPKRQDTTSPAAVEETRKGGKKAKHDKVIRDSFSIPAAEYAVIGALKKRCAALGSRMKKSELLRAGLASLNAMPDARLRETVAVIARFRTGDSSTKKHKDKGRDKTA